MVNRRDHVIQPARQLAVARVIPGATIHDIDAGHAACTLETETFVPAFVEAVATVNARRRDFRSAARTQELAPAGTPGRVGSGLRRSCPSPS